MPLAPRIPRDVPRSKPKADPRRNSTHRAFVRQFPCANCGRPAPSEAAHVRRGTDGGGSLKPSDRYCVPLCGPFACHKRQHDIGELTFWAGRDVYALAERLWTVSGDLAQGLRAIERFRQ